jgi:hypothetical protein
MSDDVQQIEPVDGEITEEWVRLTDEPEIRGVEAFTADDIDGWVVAISAQEFFRQDPLGVELRQRIQSALRAVDGVTDMYDHDNEQWDVIGNPSGEALTRAAASVIDELADRMREAIYPGRGYRDH